MNLNQIDIKNFILALFKRDDGERILLGAGAYDFKDSLQHFQANIIANDVIEKQGTDGQLLAGQVRRCQTQTFEGYIGDASTSRIDTEDYRRKFIQFFRTNHFYTVIYIMPNGEAIQRKNGYLVEAPSAPEQYQRFPEYSVGFQFEDLNYYSYSEDDQGNETYAQTVDILPEGNLTGGLVWDGDGVVWDDQGKRIAELKGDTYQQSYTGKNLLNFIPVSSQGMTVTYDAGTGVAHVSGTNSSSDGKWANICQAVECLLPAGTYTLSVTKAQSNMDFHLRVKYQDNSTGDFVLGRNNTSKTFTTSKDTKTAYIWYGGLTPTYSSVDFTVGVQLEADSSASSFEPYVGGQPSPSPSYPQPIQTVTGLQTISINGTDYPLDLGTIELCKLGTYQDYIWKDGDDWKVHKATAHETRDVGINGIRGAGSGQSTSSEAGAFSILAGDPFWLNYAHQLSRARASENLGKYLDQPSVTSNITASEMEDGTFCQRHGTNDRLYFRNTALIGKTGDDVKAILLANSGGANAWWTLETPTDTAITDTNLIAQLNAIDEALEAGGAITVTPAGANLPAIIELQPSGNGGAVWEASGGHSTNTITVGGLFAVQPVWEIIGPAESPVLENITNGTSLGYVGSIPAGQTLTIDCGAQTAILDGANVKNNVRGTWQSFEPGEVIIRYSGANVTSASTLKWNEVIG
jgi:hypothetical protein